MILVAIIVTITGTLASYFYFFGRFEGEMQPGDWGWLKILSILTGLICAAVVTGILGFVL